MATTERLGSFNDYIAEHPDAQVGDYTSALASYRAHVAEFAGVTLETLHFEGAEPDDNEEMYQA